MPALVIIIDEYAELADDAPEAMKYTDSIARLGRAVAVTIIAATQRPTQKAMGQGAVRSQMDIRICFRVRERKDVDLVLGQGMLNAGWHAQSLDAPGKFLISDPEHGTPKRARAFLVTDQAVSETAARHAANRPELDGQSLKAIRHDSDSLTQLAQDNDGTGQSAELGAPGVRDEPFQEITSAEDALWFALCMAPDKGTDIRELIKVTGMSRTTLYRHLSEHAKAGRAVQVSRGHWRAQTTEEPPR